MPPSPAKGAAGRRPPTVSVVIPALDEAGNIAQVLEGLPAVDEVIVVDGGSADDTVAVAQQAYPGVIVVRQTRAGKGNALVCGFAASRGEVIVALNGDGSNDPGEIPRFIDALMAGAQVAHGSRFRIGGDDLAGSRLGRLGNRLLCRIVNALFGTRYTDVGSGFNAFWRSGLNLLALPSPEQTGRRRERVWGDGPEIEPLVNIRMAARRLRVIEVATIRYPRIHRRHGRRRHHAWASTRRAIRVLWREYRSRHDAAPEIPAQPRAAGERAAGRHAVPEPAPRRPYPGPRPDWADSIGQHRSGEIADNGSHRRSGIYESGMHRADSTGGVRHSGLYDTGVHRTGVYDAGVHRTDVYDTGVPELPREVGGGRRRLDATDRRADGRPDLHIIPGEGTGDQSGDDPGPPHLRAVPGEGRTR